MRPTAWLARGRPPRADPRKAIALECLLGVVGVDGNTEQSDVGVASRLLCRRRYDTVQPVRVHLTGHDLRTVEQVEQE